MNRPLPRLLGIVDTALCAQLDLDPGRLARTLLDEGLPMLWLRSRELPAGELLALARGVSAHASSLDVPMVLSDRADVARLVACGVQLPSRGLPPSAARALLGAEGLIGRSTHDEHELRGAKGADYATLSPVRESTSRRGYGPMHSEAELRALARSAGLPVFALGGMGPEDITLLPDFHGLALLGPLHGLGPRSTSDVLRACLDALPEPCAATGPGLPEQSTASTGHDLREKR